QLSEMSWPEVVCRLGGRLAEALDYAHGKGVQHRDIKPANVLLAADGTPKLADFNVSFSEVVGNSTPASYFGGSLPYMSPEQLEACNPKHPRTPAEIDHRSDLYSLAVLLWELLHGEMQFEDECPAETWSLTLNQMTGRRRDPDYVHAEVSSDPLYQQLRQVLLKSLSGDPDNRHSTGQQLARDLAMCLHPRASKLLQVPSHSWRTFVRRWVLACAVLAGLVPNILAAVFNYSYNAVAVVDRMDEQAERIFWNVQFVINSIAFPAGIIIALWYWWPVYRRVSSSSSATNDSETAGQDTGLRRRALNFGWIVALVGISEWSLAWLAYPVCLQLFAKTTDIVQIYFHFAVGHILCGLVASVYPFFLLSFITVRVIYPVLCRGQLKGSDVPSLERLRQRNQIFLYLAGGIPALATMMLVVAELMTEVIFAMLFMNFAGVAGFGIAFWLYRDLQGDLSALIAAADPSTSVASQAKNAL
ncbi:MAG: serine/threonine protein kinase, partial [Planctomycetales bacterium]